MLEITLCEMLAQILPSPHPQVRPTSELKSNTKRQGGKCLIVRALLQADKPALIFCSKVSRVYVLVCVQDVHECSLLLWYFWSPIAW